MCAGGATNVASVVPLNVREVLLKDQWHAGNDLDHPALIYEVYTVL